MTLTFQEFMALAVPSVLGLAWLLRLEGRINLSDSHYADLKAALDEIRADVKTLLRQ